MAERATEPFVIVRDLCVDYEVRGGQQRAVDHVNFQINEGETLALVGESGSGKSSVAKAILRLVARSGGSVTVGGTDIFALARGPLRAFRRTMQMVFQDAGGSLTPFMTIAALLEDTLRCHGLWKVHQGDGQVGELLANVGLAPELAERYPRELSGGQRQRVALARCLAPGPAFVVLDEPLSALDVPAQADLLAMMAGLQARCRLTTLLITHHLEAARMLAKSVVVMCAGRVVETGPPSEVLTQPRHAYTQRLVASVPRLEPLGRPAATLLHQPR